MAVSTPVNEDAGLAGIHTIKVWDPLVRVIHWTLVLAILANGFITDPESDLHEMLGYGALALVALRLVWGIIGTPNARFTAFPPNPLAAVGHFRDMIRGETVVHLSHNPLGSLMVYNIWMTILVISATGIMMGTVRFFGIDWVEELHEAAFYWLMISVGLHIAGVIIDTWRTGVPLVGAMIDGKKRVPAGRQTR